MKAQLFLLTLLLGLFLAVADCCESSARARFQDRGLAPSEAEEKIQHWISRLASPSYRQREKAMNNLRKTAVPAVLPLAKALATVEDLEAHLRIHKLLEEFWKSKNPTLKKKTREVLKQLAKTNSKVYAGWVETLLFVELNKTYVGVLRVNDPPDKVRRGHPHKAHVIKLVAGHMYTIDMVGTFDTYLRLESPEGRNLMVDDDGGQGLNSRMTYRPSRTGEYRIIATCFSRTNVGAYNLTVRAKR